MSLAVTQLTLSSHMEVRSRSEHTSGRLNASGRATQVELVSITQPSESSFKALQSARSSVPSIPVTLSFLGSYIDPRI